MEDPERDKRLDAQRGPAQEDWWYQEGKVVERIHSRPRVQTFVPIGVAGSPKVKNLEAVRITKGTYSNGEVFEITDSWKTKSSARRCLERPWTGTTTFIWRTRGIVTVLWCPAGLIPLRVLGVARGSTLTLATSVSMNPCP